MTTISAKVILASSSRYAKPLYTIMGRYPRWIHAEGRTHRQLLLDEDVSEDLLEPRTPSVMEDRNLSRNASSSRAIPVKRLIEDLRNDPAVPLVWGANQKGMQGGADNNAGVWAEQMKWTRTEAWLLAMDDAIKWAEAFDAAGYHKQIVNRLLEPFTHINVLLTGTEWSNFFALRDHDAAEPHIRMFAQAVRKVMQGAEVQKLEPGEWHLPFVSHEEACRVGAIDARKISISRCGRLSYMTHEGKVPNLAEDLALYERLAGNIPMHASPLEHQATPDQLLGHNVGFGEGDGPFYKYPEKHGNLVGWIQGRKLMEGECQ